MRGLSFLMSWGPTIILAALVAFTINIRFKINEIFTERILLIHMLAQFHHDSKNPWNIVLQ